MWTFGICYSNDTYTQKIINSIQNQKGFNDKIYEIILIGPSIESIKKLESSNIKNIIFEESIRPNWVTLKKNLIVQNAKFQHICLMHDYVALCENWFEGYQKFGYDWDVCMNPVRLDNGMRHRDWFYEKVPFPNRKLEFVKYDDPTMIKRMYINATYYCINKKYALNYPLNNNLCWGQAEDVEWSFRCRDNWNYRLNPHSVVKYLKEKVLSDQNPHPDNDPDKNMNYDTYKIQL